MFDKAVFFRQVKVTTACLLSAVSLCSCADLTVTSIRDEPFLMTSRVMTCTVKNRGRKPADASKATLETRLGATAPFALQAERTTPPLAPGQEIDLQIWPIPPGTMPTSGDCLDVKVCADTEDVVDEGLFGEGNNCHTESFCP